MMPTFDFRNVLQKIVLATMRGTLSPTTIFLAFATAFGVVCTSLYNFTSQVTIPTIVINPISLDQTSSLLSLLCYVANVDQLVTVANFIILFLNLFIPFSVTFVIGILAAFWSYKAFCSVRRSIMDVAG